jgi:hypothetical protein
VQSELKYRRFVFVPTDKAKLSDGMDQTWGLLWAKFPEIRIDVEEAIYCYVLGRNTSCVFHSMRVAEHGLRRLAKRVGVRLKHKGINHPIEYADWDKIITGIKNKLDEARLLPQGPKRAASIQFHSDAADHCLYMKETRNGISHTRTCYNGPEALGTLERVKGFMEFLAGRL